MVNNVFAPSNSFVDTKLILSPGHKLNIVQERSPHIHAPHHVLVKLLQPRCHKVKMFLKFLFSHIIHLDTCLAISCKLNINTLLILCCLSLHQLDRLEAVMSPPSTGGLYLVQQLWGHLAPAGTHACFVSVVQIFLHRSQREGLSVHVNVCVSSLLYSRFIITIFTFYCRIGKFLSPLYPTKHIITDSTPGCLVGSAAGHTHNL